MLSVTEVVTRRKTNLKIVNAKREVLLCAECLLGNHRRCAHGECPCVCGEASQPSFGYAVRLEVAA
jgi:hypothetical protein